MDLSPVHTLPEALAMLEQDPRAVDVIVSSLTFSDSHMLDLLLAVKQNPKTSAIPFVVCRVMVGILSENLVESLGRAAKHCGAAEFVNLGHLPDEEARQALTAAVTRAIESRRP